jgi:hypothetical protein
MKRLILFSFPLISIIFGCKNETMEIPASVVSKDTAILIFTDLQIMEALLIQGKISQEDSVNNIRAFKEGILLKYGLDEKRFQESVDFYVSRPQLLNEIYGEALNELSQKTAETEQN